ncbi:hypothetical protein T4A_6901, partial [Trichinella pseudospiralis]
MNRNTHGEERRKVEQVTIGWIESFVGQFETHTLAKTRFAEVERERILHYKDTMNKIYYHFHRRNKRPILHYFITMMI